MPGPIIAPGAAAAAERPRRSVPLEVLFKANLAQARADGGSARLRPSHGDEPDARRPLLETRQARALTDAEVAEVAEIEREIAIIQERGRC